MMNKKILLDFEEILQFLKIIRIEVLAVCGPVNTPRQTVPTSPPPPLNIRTHVPGQTENGSLFWASPLIS